jgi:hypothetical protein
MRHVEESFLVTTAGKSPREELRQRTRRYLVTMGVRVVCVVLAIVLYELDLHWEAAVAIAASLVLPWVAVVAANAGPSRDDTADPSLYAPPQQRSIGAGVDETRKR